MMSIWLLIRICRSQFIKYWNRELPVSYWPTFETSRSMMPAAQRILHLFPLLFMMCITRWSTTTSLITENSARIPPAIMKKTFTGNLSAGRRVFWKNSTVSWPARIIRHTKIFLMRIRLIRAMWLTICWCQILVYWTLLWSIRKMTHIKPGNLRKLFPFTIFCVTAPQWTGSMYPRSQETKVICLQKKSWMLCGYTLRIIWKRTPVFQNWSINTCFWMMR